MTYSKKKIFVTYLVRFRLIPPKTVWQLVNRSHTVAVSVLLGSFRFVGTPTALLVIRKAFFWIGLNRARLEFFEPRALKWNIFLNENVICGAKKNQKFEFVSIWTIVRSFML
jgi:hypothetical protein